MLEELVTSERVEVLNLVVKRSAIGLIQHRLSKTTSAMYTESSIVGSYSLGSLRIITLYHHSVDIDERVYIALTFMLDIE